MKSKDKRNVEKKKDKKIILWEVNSFPAIEIKAVRQEIMKELLEMKGLLARKWWTTWPIHKDLEDRNRCWES